MDEPSGGALDTAELGELATAERAELGDTAELDPNPVPVEDPADPSYVEPAAGIEPIV